MLLVLSLFVLVVLFAWAIDKFDWDEDVWAAWFFISLLPFIGVLLAVGEIQICGQFNYINKTAEREVLVYRLENETSESIITQNPELYEAILEFNSSVMTTRYASENPWFNWFVYAPIGELELIDLGE